MRVLIVSQYLRPGATTDAFCRHIDAMQAFRAVCSCPTAHVGPNAQGGSHGRR